METKLLTDQSIVIGTWVRDSKTGEIGKIRDIMWSKVPGLNVSVWFPSEGLENWQDEFENRPTEGKAPWYVQRQIEGGPSAPNLSQLVIDDATDKISTEELTTKYPSLKEDNDGQE